MNLYRNISIADYHSEKTIPSRSALVQALKSPAHLNMYLNGTHKVNDSMKLGTFIHDFIENGIKISADWTTKQELYQRATNGRPAGSPKLDDEGNPLFSYVNTVDESLALTPAKSVLAVSMMKAIENDMFIVSAMDLDDLVIEPTFVGEINGMKVKARPDLAFTNNDSLIEIKTTSSLDPADIGREFFEYGYDMQAYLELELSGADRVYFYFVSSETPSGTARFCVDRESQWYKLGKFRTEKALELYYKHKDSVAESYTQADIEVPLCYKAANYMAENGIEA